MKRLKIKNTSFSTQLLLPKSSYKKLCLISFTFLRLAPQSYILYLTSYLILALAPLPLPLNSQTLQTQFTRQINRYAWEANVLHEKNEGKWQGRFQNNFRSEALVLGANLFSFRDENTQNFKLSKEINPKTTLNLYGKQYLFAQNKVFTQDLLVGLQRKLPESLSLTPLIGFSFDQRKGILQADNTTPINKDIGLATGLMGNWQKAFENGYQAQFSTQNLWQFISPRQGISMLSQGILGRNLQEKGQYQLEAKFAKLQRESYQPLSLLNRENLQQSIESVSADTLSLQFALENQLNAKWFLVSRLGMENNKRQLRTKQAPLDAIFFDTDLNHIQAEADVAFRFQGKKTRALGGVRRGAENERRRLANGSQLPPTQAAIKGDLLKKTDYDRTHLGLYGDFRLQLSDAVVLQSEASGSILRHDTPNANPDDRDEAVHQAGIKLQSRFSTYLSAEMQLWGQYHHLVYLKAERSAENNVQRILRFRPAVIWQPSSKTDFKLQPEIRVTYTVADFTLPNRSNTDQSARELRYQLEFKQDLPQNSQLNIKAETGDLRLGRLIWARFAEIPYDTIRTFSGKIGLETAKNDGEMPYKVEVGFQAFFRSDAERNLSLRYPINGTTASIIRSGKSFIRQLGPTTNVILRLKKGSEININGWLAFQRVHNELYGILPENQAQIIQETAKKGTFRLIPDVQLGTIWRF